EKNPLRGRRTGKAAEWPSGLGKGLQSPVRGFDSRLRLGRLAQWESASLTRKRSQVQSLYRPPRTAWSGPGNGEPPRPFVLCRLGSGAFPEHAVHTGASTPAP